MGFNWQKPNDCYAMVAEKLLDGKKVAAVPTWKVERAIMLVFDVSRASTIHNHVKNLEKLGILKAGRILGWWDVCPMPKV